MNAQSGESIGALLLLGFVLGIRHALDADHVAAVAAIATRSPSTPGAMKVACVWGLGHAGTLLVLGGALLALGVSLPPPLVHVVEFAVGAVLVGLGIDVLRRLRGRRIHFHVHQHEEGIRHLHAHAHPGESTHDPLRHEHRHPAHLTRRALLVGGLHGIAGTAAVVLLSLRTITSVPLAVAYLAVFAAGSVLGMVLFSAAITVPAGIVERRLGGFARGLEAACGVIAVAVGTWMAFQAVVGT